MEVGKTGCGGRRRRRRRAPTCAPTSRAPRVRKTRRRGGAPEPYSVLPSAEEAKAGEQPALARWSGVAQMAWPHTPLDAAGLGRLQLKQAARGIELPTWIPPATLAGVCKNRIGYPNQRQGERQAGGVAQGRAHPGRFLQRFTGSDQRLAQSPAPNPETLLRVWQGRRTRAACCGASRTSRACWTISRSCARRAARARSTWSRCSTL